MKELNNITNNKELFSTQTAANKQHKPITEQVQPHGMSLINFTLTEHLLEEKIETATQDVISKTKKKIADDIQRETKDLKKYMD
jgi:hypothetical protein